MAAITGQGQDNRVPSTTGGEWHQPQEAIRTSAQPSRAAMVGLEGGRKCAPICKKQLLGFTPQSLFFFLFGLSPLAVHNI